MKGRGTDINPDNRFHRLHSQDEDDGWYQETPANKVVTELYEDKAKTIISTNQSPDIPFDQSINPYKGCEHGCIYCYARPSHEYLDLSAGLDFESKLFYKPNAAELLAQTFDKPGYQCSAITIGANTDPYQPIEKQLGITRELLAVCLEYKHPVALITKGSLVLRDLDILSELAKENLCRVMVSITTLDKNLKTKLEPRTADPNARLRVIDALNQRHIPVGVLAAPMIPFINDHELEAILAECAQRQVVTVGYILLRLPLQVADLFQHWLEQHFPQRAKRVMQTLQEMRGGKVYDAKFGERMTGKGVFAQLLRQRFHNARLKYQLSNDRGVMNTELFRPKPSPQMHLF